MGLKILNPCTLHYLLLLTYCLEKREVKLPFSINELASANGERAGDRGVFTPHTHNLQADPQYIIATSPDTRLNHRY